MLFALAKSYLTSSRFTITYSFPPNASLGEKSEKAKKYPRNKPEDIFWLGH